MQSSLLEVQRTHRAYTVCLMIRRSVTFSVGISRPFSRSLPSFPGRRLVRGGLEIPVGKEVLYWCSWALGVLYGGANALRHPQRNSAKQIYKRGSKMDPPRDIIEGHHPPFHSGGDAQRHQRRLSSALGQSTGRRQVWAAPPCLHAPKKNSLRKIR